LNRTGNVRVTVWSYILRATWFYIDITTQIYTNKDGISSFNIHVHILSNYRAVHVIYNTHSGTQNISK